MSGDMFINAFVVLAVGVDVERVVASCDEGSERDERKKFGEHV